MKAYWPKKDPLTGRLVCECCYNQDHKRCSQRKKDPTRPLCDCACHDPKPKRVRDPLPETLDIEKVFGVIEV
jgi:hypothetical protein